MTLPPTTQMPLICQRPNHLFILTLFAVVAA